MFQYKRAEPLAKKNGLQLELYPPNLHQRNVSAREIMHSLSTGRTWCTILTVQSMIQILRDKKWFFPVTYSGTMRQLRSSPRQCFQGLNPVDHIAYYPSLMDHTPARAHSFILTHSPIRACSSGVHNECGACCTELSTAVARVINQILSEC